MFTANSMNCLAEGLGLALPGNGTILAVSSRAQRVRETSRSSIDGTDQTGPQASRYRDELESIDNAFALDMAMGGSTNTVLHTLAIAHEAGIEYPIERINEVAARVPHLAKIAPASDYHIEDVHNAGGVSAIINELFKNEGALNGDVLTVTGKTLRENVAGCEIQDTDVIRTLDNPHSRTRRTCRTVR